MKRLFVILFVMLIVAAAMAVKRNEAAGVTFTKDVAPIILNKFPLILPPRRLFNAFNSTYVRRAPQVL